jgi:hypothetical protein
VWPMQCIISYSLRELDTNYIYARGIFNVKFVNGLGLRVEGLNNTIHKVHNNITLFRSITMFCGIDCILRNIFHI